VNLASSECWEGIQENPSGQDGPPGGKKPGVSPWANYD